MEQFKTKPCEHTNSFNQKSLLYLKCCHLRKQSLIEMLGIKC